MASRHSMALLRDVVEVLAIAAAGIWAIYTFIYLERIKPAADAPAVTINGSLYNLGRRGALVQFAFSGRIHNSGRTRLYVIATGYTVTGVRVMPQSSPSSVVPYAGALLYERNARITSSDVLYRFYSLTGFAKQGLGGARTLEPGEEVPFGGILAVNSRQYDAIELDCSLAYAKYPAVYPTRVWNNYRGVLIFYSRNRDPRFYSTQVTLNRATLW